MASKRDKSSGEYSLMLNRALRREDDSKRESAREAFEQARKASEPPDLGSEMPPPARLPDDLGPARGPMSTDSAVTEVKAASVALTTSVDQISEAMILVFGEMRSTSATLSAVTRVLVLLMVGQMLVFGFMGYMVWRLESVVDEAEITRAEQVVVLSELQKIKISANETQRTVAEVREKTEEASKVEIVPDNKKPGSAVVRIVPASKSTETAPEGVSKPGDAGSTSVEIPLDLKGVRPVSSQSH